jgi:two-component system chemotaxis response regulator CheB
MDKKVLIVEDSPLFAEILNRIISNINGFSVYAEAGDVRQATSCIRQGKPDLIILDAELPGIDGIRFLRNLLPQCPLPVIICTSHRTLAQPAMSAGAADFIPKPADYAKDFEKFRQTLTDAVKNAVNLPCVVCDGKTYRLKKSDAEKKQADRLILIGGSAGSTEALPEILKDFTPDMPPVAATLHMPEGYTELYAKRLDSTLPIEVFEAVDGMRLRCGMAAIAQGAKHLRIGEDDRGFYLKVTAGEKISGHCPSVDALFESAAKLRAERIIAVILTGMGSDGAKGLLKLKNSGAYTIGQDEKTSLVYGMPKAAYDLGAVRKQRSLGGISAEIKRKLKETEQ